VVLGAAFAVGLLARGSSNGERRPAAGGRLHRPRVRWGTLPGGFVLGSGGAVVGELFGQLTQDLALLVRQEAQLAKTEIQGKVSRATGNLVSLAAGGLVALLVAAVFGGGGCLMLQGGLRDLKSMDPTPRRTVENIREDIQMAKERRP
jgi:hypothetical protein